MGRHESQRQQIAPPGGQAQIAMPTSPRPPIQPKRGQNPQRRHEMPRGHIRLAVGHVVIVQQNGGLRQRQLDCSHGIVGHGLSVPRETSSGKIRSATVPVPCGGGLRPESPRAPARSRPARSPADYKTRAPADPVPCRTPLRRRPLPAPILAGDDTIANRAGKDAKQRRCDEHSRVTVSC